MVVFALTSITYMVPDRSRYSRKESYYDRYARFYDAIIDARFKGSDSEAKDADRTETEFYVERAVHADGPVLEVGCGTGRIYLELLRSGVDAYGIDISEKMLEILERRAERELIEPQVRRAEMQTFTPRREYETVIIPSRTFLHNVSREDQRQTLANIYNALAPGGQLVCNFYTPNFVTLADRLSSTIEHEFRYEGETFTVRIDEEYDDKVHNVVNCVQTIEDENGSTVEEISTRIKLVTKDEFALLLETAGFDDWNLFGGFDLEPHHNVDDEMVWIATA